MTGVAMPTDLRHLSRGEGCNGKERSESRHGKIERQSVLAQTGPTITAQDVVFSSDIGESPTVPASLGQRPRVDVIEEAPQM